MGEKDLQMTNPFDVTVEMIEADLAPYAAFNMTDFSDPVQIRQLEEGLRVLQKKRTSITNAGKAWREASNAYNKAVLAIEKELLSHVLPIESKLKNYQSMLALLALREANKTKLFDRQQALKEQSITLNDDTILEMTDEQFEKAIQESVKAERIKNASEYISVDPQVFARQWKIPSPFPSNTFVWSELITKLLKEAGYNKDGGDIYTIDGEWITVYRKLSFIPREAYDTRS